MSNLFKTNLYLKTFGFFKIPLIFYVNPKVILLNNEEIKVAIPLNRRTRNHYGSMYFGALAVGADISVGLFAMSLVKKSGADMLLLFKDFQIEFHQRAEGETIFSCRDHEKINNQLKDEGKKFTLVNHRGKFKLRGTFMFENAYCMF